MQKDMQKKQQKEKNYITTIKILDTLYMEEGDLVANFANTAAVLKEQFNFWWAGFYMVDPENRQLIVGPYQGPLACGRIDRGKGVCGHSWEKKKTLIVDNVEDFPGHVSCSPEAKSEIVVPILVEGEVKAVLDVDSDKLANFDKIDKKYLERICEELSNLF